MPKLLSPAQRRVLKDAADRPRGNVCPTRGLHGEVQTAVLRALDGAGLIDNFENGYPFINDFGRAAVGDPSS